MRRPPHGHATTGGHDTACATLCHPGRPLPPGARCPVGLSSTPMQEFLSAILAGASGEEIAAIPIPKTYRAAYVKRDEQAMFEGLESEDKDPRKSLHVGDVATPELAPDEAYIAVMASAINFNTVWTSIFEPLPTFGFLDRLAREGVWGARHALDYHVADLAVVKAKQLMPKPAHLSWEEAAVNALCNSTSYRMLVSHNGAPITQGDKVLVWGASGGLGAFAVQYCLNGGATPVGVVSSQSKVDLLHDLGVEAVIDRKAADYRFWKDEHTQDESEWRRLGKDIRGLVGDDVDIVFEHPGRQTIKGSHFANYREAWDANKLVCEGKILPPLSAVHTLDNVGEAAYQVHRNLHEGKIGVLCLAPDEGLGIDDHELRHKVGEDRITLFRRHGA